MKIAIVGAGAMGSLYGGLLAESGNEVYLIDVWKDHVEAINTKGLHIEGLSGDRIINNIKATLNPSEVGIVDLVLIFVKSTITDKAIADNKVIFGSETVALTLQNGLGNVEKMSTEINEENVIAGTTAHGSTLLGPGEIKHAGQGKTIIGELNGKASERIIEIYKTFTEAKLETEISNNVIGLIWDKLLVNVGINALTAITEMKNGQLVEFSETEEILEAAVREAMEVAEKKGIVLGFDNPITHCKDVCVATAENRASMLQDVINKRQTEIDMINGAIVAEGKKLGINTPVNMVLTNLVKAKQKNY